MSKSITILKSQNFWNDEIFGCDCHCITHVFSICFFEKELEDPSSMYINIILENHMTLFKRILSGGKFLFCNKSNFVFSGIMLKDFDMDRLVNILRKKGIESGNLQSPVEIENGQYILRFDRQIEKWDGYAMSEFIVSVEFPRNLGFFRRFWRSIKFIWGWKSRYGYTDDFEIDEQQAKSIMYLAELHRDFSKEESEKESESTEHS